MHVLYMPVVQATYERCGETVERSDGDVRQEFLRGRHKHKPSRIVPSVHRSPDVSDEC